MVYSKTQSKTLQDRLLKIIQSKALKCYDELTKLDGTVDEPAIVANPDADPPIVAKDAVMKKPQFLDKDMTDAERDKRYDYWKRMANKAITDLQGI